MSGRVGDWPASLLGQSNEGGQSLPPRRNESANHKAHDSRERTRTPVPRSSSHRFLPPDAHTKGQSPCRFCETARPRHGALPPMWACALRTLTHQPSPPCPPMRSRAPYPVSEPRKPSVLAPMTGMVGNTLNGPPGTLSTPARSPFLDALTCVLEFV